MSILSRYFLHLKMELRYSFSAFLSPNTLQKMMSPEGRLRLRQETTPGSNAVCFTSFFNFARVKTDDLTLEGRIDAFAALGEVMREGAAGAGTGLAGRFSALADTLFHTNPWFTPENVRRTLSATGNALSRENLVTWLQAYPGIREKQEPVIVGVVMAGNIPMVGFHDLLCVLITGNHLLARLSTKDETMMRAVAAALVEIEPGFGPAIELTTERLKGFGRVIATGSNNTSRYFEYYFRNVPSIIRRNRNSIAILDGT
ncbi:hypothetical protein EG830_13020, partial [bacterium]|nr:hypothetical protein [bacterium]